MQRYDNKNNYDDIIDLQHHQSVKHPHMSSHDRAAQFSPFAALTGYGDAVAETARTTETKAELDEYCREALSRRINIILGNLDKQPKVSITYFLPDKKKSGGKYITSSGCVKRLSEYRDNVVMRNGTEIPIDDIVNIEGDLFDSLENF